MLSNLFLSLMVVKPPILNKHELVNMGRLHTAYIDEEFLSSWIRVRYKGAATWLLVSQKDWNSKFLEL